MSWWGGQSGSPPTAPAGPPPATLPGTRAVVVCPSALFPQTNSFLTPLASGAAVILPAAGKLDPQSFWVDAARFTSTLVCIQF